MWHTGHPAPEQCDGRTWVRSQVRELSYVHSRDVTYATFCHRRLLVEWAAKYRERYRWRLRRSFEVANPFGSGVRRISEQLQEQVRGAYAFTGAAAASLVAPFVELDRVGIFLSSEDSGAPLRKLAGGESSGPNCDSSILYDNGVFLYSRREGSMPIVSNFPAYLDLCGRGGRTSNRPTIC